MDTSTAIESVNPRPRVSPLKDCVAIDFHCGSDGLRTCHVLRMECGVVFAPAEVNAARRYPVLRRRIMEAGDTPVSFLARLHAGEIAPAEHWPLAEADIPQLVLVRSADLPEFSAFAPGDGETYSSTMRRFIVKLANTSAGTLQLLAAQFAFREGTVWATATLPIEIAVMSFLVALNDGDESARAVWQTASPVPVH